MADNNIYSYHTLANGLRIVHRQARSGVEYCGVAVNVGSRDEAIEHYGLAHFVEHTIFKGTSHRRAWHIINRMEAVGGELNAYTTKEETMLYSIFPSGNLNRAIDLIADLVTSSQFPANELDKEREVVADEINSYLDSPSEAVFDDFEDLMFGGSSLGHNILGTTDTIATFTPEVCRNYLARYYTAPNMVFFYMGSERPSKVFKITEKYFGSLSNQLAPINRVIPSNVVTFDIKRDLGNHQCHTIIGSRIEGMYSEQRYPTALFTNIVGGPGMNSLLNISLRERRGLVYTVEASSAMFTDSGAFAIYFGCDHNDLNRCRRLVINQLDTLASKALTSKQIEAAKKQYLGQLIVASENREQAAITTGRSMLYHNHVASSDEVLDSINAITPEQVRQVAESIAKNISTLSFL
ncbi:MAG: insulinase family protein [Bacteroidales bacterium]|nr:insulinase family protein [Bacteroidales bacterium]